MLCRQDRLISRGRGTLAQERPDLADQWDHDLNGTWRHADTVQAGSGLRELHGDAANAASHCERPHVWQATVNASYQS